MRLTSSQVSLHRGELEEWLSPDAMLGKCDALMGLMGSADLFAQPGAKFILEAWAAAKLAKARHAEAVRLIDARQQWPDFELLIGGELEQWESTEADEPSRRRADEYRDADARRDSDGLALSEDSVEDWIRRAEEVPKVMRQRCAEKAAKRYGSKARLLIYLNLTEYGIRQKQVEASMAINTAPAKDAFLEVWVLWKDHAYAVWRNGARVAATA